MSLHGGRSTVAVSLQGKRAAVSSRPAASCPAAVAAAGGMEAWCACRSRRSASSWQAPACRNAMESSARESPTKRRAVCDSNTRFCCQPVAHGVVHALPVLQPRRRSHRSYSLPPLPRLQLETVLPSLHSTVHLGAYRGEHGWWLLHVRADDNPGGTEWVFIDEGWRDRFVHDGNTLIPGAGPRWRHVSREPRTGAPPATPQAEPQADGGGGAAWHGGQQLRAHTEQDREAELPWQVIGVRDPGMLENLRRQSRQHNEAAAAAATRQALPRGSAPEAMQEPPAEHAELPAAAAAVLAEATDLLATDVHAASRRLHEAAEAAVAAADQQPGDGVPRRWPAA
eukprot:523695-Prymnesium_polylepis.1